MNELDEIVESLLKDNEYYQSKATRLISANQLKEKDRELIKESITNPALRESIGRAFDLIHKDMGRELNREESVAFFKDLETVNPETIDHLSERVEALSKEGKEITFQQIFSLPDNDLKKIYVLGYKYFQNKQIDNAFDIFILLITLNPYVADFWHALGLSYEAKNDLPSAIEAHTVASTLDKNHIAAHISLAKCLISQNRQKEGLELLERAQKIIDQNPALERAWGKYLKQKG